MSATGVTGTADMALVREDGRFRLVFEGALNLETTPRLWAGLDDVAAQAPPLPLEVDLSAVTTCDMAGAALLRAVRSRLGASPEDVVFAGGNEQVNGMLAIVAVREDVPERVAKRGRSLGIVEGVGAFVIDVGRHIRETLEYVGSLLQGVFFALTHPRNVRWRDLFHYMAQAGADAFGIVALLSFLIGVILAYQTVAMLSPYGLDGFVVQAVALGVVTELGPLMTAIIVAGRSGSGFAAEIGTMKVNEEVDALETMGLDKTRFLVLPKLLALLGVMPFLVIFSGLFGVLGGLFIGVVSVDLSVGNYLEGTAEALGPWDVSKGLIKGEAYALVIAAVGCLRGIQTARGAQGVGRSATSAVVTSIFLIICVDALLTVVYHNVDLFFAN